MVNISHRVPQMNYSNMQIYRFNVLFIDFNFEMLIF